MQYHLRNKCPQLEDWRSPRRGYWGKKPIGRQDHSATKSAGPGLYIPVNFRGQVLSCLIDTGASLSVLSTRIWENSDLCKPVRLHSYDKAIVTASGNTLDVSGTTTIAVKIGYFDYRVEGIIADIENDMLMGLDFMKQYNCALDIVNNVLTINEEKLTLNCEGNIGCHRVVAKEDVNVPAMPEKIIHGKVINLVGQTNDLFQIGQADVVRENVGIVAKALLQGNDCVPLRIMNVSGDLVVLRLNVPVNNFSVISGRSHRFLGN